MHRPLFCFFDAGISAGTPPYFSALSFAKGLTSSPATSTLSVSCKKDRETPLDKKASPSNIGRDELVTDPRRRLAFWLDWLLADLSKLEVRLTELQEDASEARRIRRHARQEFRDLGRKFQRLVRMAALSVLPLYGVSLVLEWVGYSWLGRLAALATTLCLATVALSTVFIRWIEDAKGRLEAAAEPVPAPPRQPTAPVSEGLPAPVEGSTPPN